MRQHNIWCVCVCVCVCACARTNTNFIAYGSALIGV